MLDIVFHVANKVIEGRIQKYSKLLNSFHYGIIFSESYFFYLLLLLRFIFSTVIYLNFDFPIFADSQMMNWEIARFIWKL